MSAAVIEHPATPPPSPEQLWRVFAGAIAGRERVRVRTPEGRYRDGGRLKPEVYPTVPTAVLIYDSGQRARCLVLDFDAGLSSGRGQVLLDVAHALELARRAGLPAFVDESISGGRHVYLPLAEPISAGDALEVGHALRAVMPTLDTAPLSNGRTGAIRPPGSPHQDGGHQYLVSSLEQAVAAVMVPGSASEWQRFVLQATRLTGPALPRAIAAPSRQERLCRPGPAKPALEPYASTLRTGKYDAQAYPTDSHARFAALCHLLRRSWSEQAIAVAAVDGTFPGLLQLFTKQPDQLTALGAELRRAGTKLLTVIDRPYDRSSHTRVPPSPPLTDRASLASHPHPAADGGDEYGFLRSWWTAAGFTRSAWSSTTSLVDRSVLQALGALAQMRGSRYVDVGTRALAQAACLDHSTVAKALRRLRGAHDPFLVLLDPAENSDGSKGDLYELVVPERHIGRSVGQPWAAGVIERIHPAFWVLSRGTRYVWQALRNEPLSMVELREHSGLAKETHRSALLELASHGLARQVRGQWRRGHTTLNQVARRLGGEQKAADVAARHLVERRAWRALRRLSPPAPDRRPAPARAAAAAERTSPLRLEDLSPSADAPDAGQLASEESALALLSRELGAIRIA